MAQSTTVRQVLFRVGSLLNDLSPQFTGWTEVELVQWLNDGQMAITKYLPTACTRLLLLRLAAGTRQSIERIAAADAKGIDGSTFTTDLAGNQLIDVVRNMGADGATPGLPIRVTLRDSLDLESPGWHSSVASSSGLRHYSYNPQLPRHFYVYPGVPTSRLWVEAALTLQPRAVPAGGAPGAEVYRFSGTSTVAVDLDDEFIDDLVNYIVARASQKQDTDASAATADRFASMFTASINAKVSALTGNNPNLQVLPFAAEPIGVAQ